MYRSMQMRKSLHFFSVLCSFQANCFDKFLFFRNSWLIEMFIGLTFEFVSLSHWPFKWNSNDELNYRNMSKVHCQTNNRTIQWVIKTEYMITECINKVNSNKCVIKYRPSSERFGWNERVWIDFDFEFWLWLQSLSFFQACLLRWWNGYWSSDTAYEHFNLSSISYVQIDQNLWSLPKTKPKNTVISK